jgi:hypothetical protein
MIPTTIRLPASAARAYCLAVSTEAEAPAEILRNIRRVDRVMANLSFVAEGQISCTFPKNARPLKQSLNVLQPRGVSTVINRTAQYLQVLRARLQHLGAASVHGQGN